MREEAIARKVEKFETQTELYMLVAELSSYYLCPACPPEATKKGKYYLKEGEVYKYGITTNAKNRYSKAELLKWKLNYVLLDAGNYTDMASKEVVLNGNYPILPENLARTKHYRLAIPPGSGVVLR